MDSKNVKNFNPVLLPPDGKYRQISLTLPWKINSTGYSWPANL